MLFLIAFKNDSGKYLIKIGLEDGKEKWATTSEAVYTYAKANFKAKEEVDYELTENNGSYNVTKINKKGQKSAPVAETPKTEVAPKTTTGGGIPCCSDCGKELKDTKYKKCFDCNKKNPSPKKTYSGGGRQDGAVGKSIEKQAMMKASAMAVGSAFVGQVGTDANILADMIIVVYEKLLRKLTE